MVQAIRLFYPGTRFLIVEFQLIFEALLLEPLFDFLLLFHETDVIPSDGNPVTPLKVAKQRKSWRRDLDASLSTVSLRRNVLPTSIKKLIGNSKGSGRGIHS